MSIIRTHHDKENPYVMLNKISIWDSDLSLEAVGLWTRLMSRPDNWKVRSSELCKSCGVGKDKMRSLLKQLIERGFAYRWQTIAQNGRYTDWETLVFETKKTPEEIKKMFPEPENPSPVKPAPVNSPLLNIDSTKQSSKDDFKDKRERRRPPAPPLLLEKGKFVRLKKEDLYELYSQFGAEKTERSILDMNDYLESHGKKGYTSYKAALRKWMRKEFKDSKKIVQRRKLEWEAKSPMSSIESNRDSLANDSQDRPSLLSVLTAEKKKKS